MSSAISGSMSAIVLARDGCMPNRYRGIVGERGNHAGSDHLGTQGSDVGGGNGDVRLPGLWSGEIVRAQEGDEVLHAVLHPADSDGHAWRVRRVPVVPAELEADGAAGWLS